MFRTGFVSLAAALASTVCAAQTCSSFNFTSTQDFQKAIDTQEHLSLNHNVSMFDTGSCTYTAQSSTTECAIVCDATNVSGYVQEQGMLAIGREHGTSSAIDKGRATSNGPAITCGAQYAGAIRSCLTIFTTCDIGVSITGSSHGIGGSTTTSVQAKWTATLHNPYSCGARQRAATTACYPPGPAPYLPPDVGAQYVWDYTTCRWVMVACTGYNGCNSPILIDTTGEGFRMTSADDGTKFDYGKGPVQTAWTAKGSRNGWLALPNKDGQIITARDELFGNATAQYLTKDHEPNGFAALAVWDDPNRGGNSNGSIDPGDAVWGRLRVWIDASHDGVAQPDELHTLDSLGYGGFDLGYTTSPLVDQFGNAFRFKGKLRPVNHNDVIDRKIFDVFPVTK